uniref:Immunoglobulin domain-containing protein n=1 Tax=Hucho hucho TaxID=62062 RepID=A0A4W5LR84_9TELE
VCSVMMMMMVLLRVCSLKGSSVTMPCSYTVPKGHKVTTAFWFKGQMPGAESLDLNLNPEYKGRVEYLGDSDRLCTLRITDLRESDSGTYSFLFGTDENVLCFMLLSVIFLSLT